MDSHDQIHLRLGEILGEIKGVNQRLDRTNGRLDKHDFKIDALEAFKDQATGKLAMVGVAAAFLFSIVGAAINNVMFKN
ncbi:MAG: hypothetical protein Q6360_13135 [Candidatus Brocadiales bacterium]|nr:hypothetical protein [Candidatus Brocadiales bacterium]